jgi:hypothetical protein
MQSTNQEIEIVENEPKMVQLKGTVVKNNNQVGSVNLSIGFVTSSNATVKFLSDNESSDDDYDENNEKVKYVHKFQAALSQQQNRAVEANNENRKKEITNKKNSRVSFDQCQSKTTKGPSYSSTPTNTRRCNSSGNLNKFKPITNIARKKNENQEFSTIRNEEENDVDSPTIRNEEEEEFLTFQNDDENDSLPHYQVNRVDESIPVNELESFSIHNTSQSLINTKNIKPQSDLSNLQADDLNKTPAMMPSSSSSSRFQHQHTPIPMSKNDDYISKSDISSDDHDSHESLKDDYDHLITLDNQTTPNLDTLVDDDDDDKQLSSTLKERTEQSEQKENFSSFSNNSNKTEKKKLVLTESPNMQSIINSNQKDSVLEAGQSKSPNKRSSDPIFSNKIMDEHYTTARQISTLESSNGSASKSASGNVSEKESISSVGQLDEISFIDKNKIASPESRLKGKNIWHIFISKNFIFFNKNKIKTKI